MSGDIQLTWSSVRQAADFSLSENDLTTDAGLRTAILLSLYTDRRAEPGDVLPQGDTDRRGWWADEFNETPDDKFGSRLWLLARSKRQSSVLVRAREYALESLQWLLDDRVASELLVTAEFPSSGPDWALDIVVVRPAGDTARFRFGPAWEAERARV